MHKRRPYFPWLEQLLAFNSCKLANVFKFTQITATQAADTLCQMSITRDHLLTLYPEHSERISKLSAEDLQEINDFLDGKSDECDSGSTITVDKGHTLATKKEDNVGSGGKLSSGAKGYRPDDIPRFSSNTAYNVDIQSTSIILKVDSKTYKYITNDSSIKPSNADGTFA